MGNPQGNRNVQAAFASYGIIASRSWASTHSRRTSAGLMVERFTMRTSSPNCQLAGPDNDSPPIWRASLCANPVSLIADVVSHPHTTIDFHPMSRNSFCTRASLATFDAIFVFQKPRLFFGKCPRLHACPCQKQPFTKTIVRYFGSTMSGVPGRSVLCNLNL